MTDQDPAAARLEYLARVLANPPAFAHPCAAGCGQPLTRWNVDAEGRRWHPDCLPPGTAMPITRSDREWQTLLGKATTALDLATEFRIPCPEAADPGRPEGAPILQPEPLIVQKVQAHWADRFPDGWRIFNPNLEPGDHVWTGDEWAYRGRLHIGVIYQWTRDQAIAEAQRLAIEETRRYETWLNDMRGQR